MRSALLKMALGALFFIPYFSTPSAGQDIIRMRENIHIQKGEEAGDVISIMGSVTVEGKVRSASAILGNVTIDPSGVVEENAVAVGGRVISREGSRIQGEIVSLGPQFKETEKYFLMGIPIAAGIIAGLIGVAALLSGLGFLALVIIVLLLFERQVQTVRKIMEARPWKSLVLGLLTFILSIPIMLFLVITLVGIPLAFILAAILMAALILGWVGASYSLGELTRKKLGWSLRPVWSGLLGLGLLFLLGMVPVVGSLAHMAALLFGVGAVVQTRFNAA